jgi:hypothetical protein
VDLNPRMADFDATVRSLAQHAFGALYEAEGFARLEADARRRLHDRLVGDGLRAGFAVAGDLDAGTMDFLGGRAGGWPDVRLERADDDRLVVAVIATPSSARNALHLVVRALRANGLELERILPHDP